ncbi:hypothetical protein H5410_064188 [Solanum commersonii]|uniref:Uncharacterized protein n=1 Tax=Solanum commersonii TaxID=4109 RepID=A0A9J5W073_SOLCO|nr:hypothetical protein H5410_064188 [Solanum commersonii]
MSLIPRRSSPLAGFFENSIYSGGMQAGLYFLVLIDSYKRCFYLLLSKNNQIPFKIKQFHRISMIVCVIASTIPGISMNPIIAIAQDSLF